jgi:hypothetical protein
VHASFVEEYLPLPCLWTHVLYLLFHVTLHFFAIPLFLTLVPCYIVVSLVSLITSTVTCRRWWNTGPLIQKLAGPNEPYDVIVLIIWDIFARFPNIPRPFIVAIHVSLIIFQGHFGHIYADVSCVPSTFGLPTGSWVPRLSLPSRLIATSHHTSMTVLRPLDHGRLVTKMMGCWYYHYANLFMGCIWPCGNAHLDGCCIACLFYIIVLAYPFCFSLVTWIRPYGIPILGCSYTFHCL